MKKTVIKICLIITIVLTLFIMIKIYHFCIINKMYNAIKDFRENKNRYYSVEINLAGEVNRKEEIIYKDNKLKYIILNSSHYLYYEWKNLETNEQYIFNLENKELYNCDMFIISENILFNLPDMLLNIIKKDKITLKTVLDLDIIFTTKYNDKNCYKIRTKTEEIIIDKFTFLPIYSKKKIINSDSENKNKMEYTYKFRINDVTDEEIALPDLSDYKVIDK